MDKETKDIVTEQIELKSFTETKAWGIIRLKYTEKVLALQNAFDIDSSDPQRMFLDLQARKIASTILFDFLRDIEGSAAQAEDNKDMDKPYIVRL